MLLRVLHRHHRNPNTRRAYFWIVESFAIWYADRYLIGLARVTLMHVAAHVEQLGSCRLDSYTHAVDFVGAEIVHPHHLPRPQLRACNSSGR